MNCYTTNPNFNWYVAEETNSLSKTNLSGWDMDFNWPNDFNLPMSEENNMSPNKIDLPEWTIDSISDKDLKYNDDITISDKDLNNNDDNSDTDTYFSSSDDMYSDELHPAKRRYDPDNTPVKKNNFDIYPDTIEISVRLLLSKQVWDFKRVANDENGPVFIYSYGNFLTRLFSRSCGYKISFVNNKWCLFDNDDAPKCSDPKSHARYISDSLFGPWEAISPFMSWNTPVYYLSTNGLWILNQSYNTCKNGIDKNALQKTDDKTVTTTPVDNSTFQDNNPVGINENTLSNSQELITKNQGKLSAIKSIFVKNSKYLIIPVLLVLVFPTNLNIQVKVSTN